MIGAPEEIRGPDRRDRPGFTVYFAALGLTVVAVFASGFVGPDAPGAPWVDRGIVLVVAWGVFCAAANVLPVPTSTHIALSMGAPANVAIAFLFPPSAAAAIVFVSSVSEWELKRETTVSHAVFNRLQLAASTALAASAFRIEGTGDALPPIWVLVVAVTAYQAANWCFVAVAEWSARGVPLLRVLRRLVPANPVAALTYLVLGFMGIVLALTSVRIGPWGVALVMLPLLSARHAVNVSGQLQQAERERRALADRLIDERERERVRIASDIHDVVLQQLAALQLSADSIGAALDHDRPDTAVRLAGQLRRGVDATIAELRRTIASLRRSAIDDDGLAPSLERFARAFRVSTGIDVRVDVRGGAAVPEELPLPVALLLVECAQEALTNVARHAPEATQVDVGVERSGGTVELVVRDDGPGMSALPTVVGAGGRRSGLALSREKVELSGGLLFVDSRLGQGTTVTVRVPVGAVS